MNDFIKEMLQLGAELEKSTSGVAINMIINDAEIAYNNHISTMLAKANARPLATCKEPGLWQNSLSKGKTYFIILEEKDNLLIVDDNGSINSYFKERFEF